MAVERTSFRISRENLRFRSGDRADANLQAGIIKQRLSGQGVLRLRSGDSQADLTRFLGMRQPVDIRVAVMPAEVDKLSQAVASCQAISPKTLTVKGQTYKCIMAGELTSQEGAQILKPEDVEGHNAAALKAQLSDPSGKPLTYVNAKDTLNIVKATGGALRLMTNAEVDNMPDAVRSQLKGDNYFLVETERGSGRYNWLRLGVGLRDFFRHPGARSDDHAVRLVGDL